MIGRFQLKHDGRSPLLLVLLLVALVPAVCVLWLITVATRNERLAVERKLTSAYVTHLGSVQRELTSFWRDQHASAASAAGGSASARFAGIIHSNVADGAIIYAASGEVLYPAATATNSIVQVAEDPIWTTARELEFRLANHVGAAEAYERIAQDSSDIHVQAQAIQAQAGCLLKAGNRSEAIRILDRLATNSMWRHATSEHGTLLIPNVQLLLLKLIGDLENERFRDVLDRAAARLNDYGDAGLSSSQRRFLMEELQRLAPGKSFFPTLAAEQLAEDYLEANPSPPVQGTLQTTPLPGVYQIMIPDRSAILLFREERLLSELKRLIDRVALPDIVIQLVHPNDSLPRTTTVPLHDAADWMPGWRLALTFRGPDPFEAASTQQTRIYFGIGSIVIVATALLALIAGRFVSAQMRLTRMKDDLVSTVSHELKTPLASMRMLVDTLLAGRYHGPDHLDRYLKLIAKENHRLSHLIENFLSFSRLARNKQQFLMQDVKAGAIVQDALEAMQDRLTAPNCQLTVDVDPDLPVIRGDRQALASVVINLLDNAYKYTGSNKQIRLRACHKNATVQIEVADNGIGLSSRETERIFDRFYQVDQSLAREQSGCGLGLSIVRFIVEGHNGSISVNSQPGTGSTFTVRLPLTNNGQIEL